MQKWKQIWVASLEISDQTEAKIRSKHHLTGDQIRIWLICNKSFIGVDLWDRKHGIRTVTFCEIRDGRYLLCFINLIDNDFDKWRLRSARTAMKIPKEGR